jgi:hypothetical protein
MGRLNTVDLLPLTSLDPMLLILQPYLLFTKQQTEVEGS